MWRYSTEGSSKWKSRGVTRCWGNHISINLSYYNISWVMEITSRDLCRHSSISDQTREWVRVVGSLVVCLGIGWG